MIRRASVMLTMLAALAVAAGLPASAKIPPFEVEVTVDEGVAHIRVQGLFQSSTLQSEDFDPADLDGLLAVYPTGDLDDQGRPLIHDNSMRVDLEWVGGPDLYEGRVRIDVPESWAVVPFPTVAGFDPGTPIHADYPTAVGFDVPASNNRHVLVLGGALTLLAIGVVRRLRGSGTSVG